MTVHTALGAGLLESTYDACLYYELTRTGLHFEHQVRLPVIYQGSAARRRLPSRLPCRKLRHRRNQGVEKLLPVHSAQLLSYLKLSGVTVGLLINFNVATSASKASVASINGYRT